MSYVITGLDPAPFAPLYGLSDADLAAHGAIRMPAAHKPGFPCRITLEDADPGESVLLVNHAHLAVDSPYRSSYAIFVREGAETPARHLDEVPEQLSSRLLSARAFDDDDMLIDAEVLAGTALDALARDWLERPEVSYIHVHNAGPGCFAARIDRQAS